MIVSLIVAVGENGVIGRDGGLPWRVSSDLKTFRRITMGKPMIMGRKTFQSIGKPLDGRDTIVITRDSSFSVPGISAVASFPEALTLARVLAATRGADEIMVIGGAQVFHDALPFATRIYWTEVQGAPAGDVFFAKPPDGEWREVSRQPLPKGANDEFAATLVILERGREARPAN